MLDFLATPIKRLARAFRSASGGASEAEVAKLYRRIERLEKTLLDQAKGQHNAMLGRIGRRGVQRLANQIDVNLPALVRRHYLDATTLPYPQRLTSQRFRLHSQNGEDGITYAVLNEVGTIDQRFVEIGAGVNGGNSGFLADECGWSGLMIDASESNAARLRQRFPWDRIAIEQAIVTRENVNDLLSRHGLVDDIDFASVDIDGDDYWIWESLTVGRPRLLIIEYNSLLGPDRAVVVPYQSPSHKDVSTAVETGYYGASLSALTRLGASKDYRLVAVEPRGVNAFFLRNDVGPEIPACAPTEAFRMFENYQKRVAAGGIDQIYARIEQDGWPLVRLD